MASRTGASFQRFPTTLQRRSETRPQAKEPVVADWALIQNCPKEARFREFSMQPRSRMESMSWRRRPRSTTFRSARHARSAACAARSRGCGSAQLARCSGSVRGHQNDCFDDVLGFKSQARRGRWRNLLPAIGIRRQARRRAGACCTGGKLVERRGNCDLFLNSYAVEKAAGAGAGALHLNTGCGVAYTAGA